MARKPKVFNFDSNSNTIQYWSVSEASWITFAQCSRVDTAALIAASLNELPSANLWEISERLDHSR